jgi:CBS domain-containing protein
MPTAFDAPGHDPAAVTEFLKNTVPFTALEGETLKDLVQRFSRVSFPGGTVVFRQDVDDVDHFYLIFSGRLKTYLTGLDGAVTLLDFRDKGGYFGALAIIRGSKANFSVETLEPTVCLALEKEIFLDLLQNHPRFAQHYLKTFSEDLATTAFAQIRSIKSGDRTPDGFHLHSKNVGEVIGRPAEFLHASQTIQQAAQRMSELEIGSVLIHDQSGELVGIVTDKDLRKKVVATGLDCNVPVATVMSSPVRRIPYHTLWFDALLHMMKERVYHLAVERDDEIVGVVSVRDFMLQAGASPLYLFREIEGQRTIEGLYSLSEKIPRVVRSLVEEGARSSNITRIISVLNDQIVHRLLTMLDAEMGPAVQPFCWITFGSEGRKEQTFKTDQDNAIIYKTPPDDPESIKEARLYFRRFGNEVIRHLEACGYPLCPGKMMASNPKWRKPYRTWREYFDRWINTPEPEEVLRATIFFDFRPVYGELQFGADLRDHLTQRARSEGIFLLHLARDFLSGKTPLTLFKGFQVEKEGKYKNCLDLKKQGLTPFVNFARLMALRHGIAETNTQERIEAVAKGDLIPRGLYLETRDAYEFQMQLRLVHQLRLIEVNKPANNFVDPSELSDVEKQTLKESLSVINRIQSYVKSEFSVLT